MTVTKESGGRLNAFAEEPQMEIITEKDRSALGSKIFQVLGVLLFLGLVAFSITIK